MSRGQDIDMGDLKRQFKDHVATYQKIYCVDGSTMERLLWKKPGTNHFMLEYIRKDGILYVSGDLGFASYWWSGNNSLKWISECHIGYFAGKCEASENGRSFTVWDMDVANASIREYIADEDDRSGEEGESEKLLDRFETANGFDSISSEYEWVAWCYEHAQEVFGDAWWESLGSPGMVLNIRCRYHLEGLKLAIAALEADNPSYDEDEVPEGFMARIRRFFTYGGNTVVQKNIKCDGIVAGGNVSIKK